MLKKSERLLYRLAILLIHCSTWSIWYAGCLAKVFVAIVQAAELWPFADNHIHRHGIACHLVLRGNQRAGPVAIERFLHPFGIWCSVNITGAIGAVNEEEKGLLTHVLMSHEIDECLIAGLSVFLVLTHIVVGILPPKQVYVGCSIPVLSC